MRGIFTSNETVVSVSDTTPGNERPYDSKENSLSGIENGGKVFCHRNIIGVLLWTNLIKHSETPWEW